MHHIWCERLIWNWAYCPKAWSWSAAIGRSLRRRRLGWGSDVAVQLAKINSCAIDTCGQSFPYAAGLVFIYCASAPCAQRQVLADPQETPSESEAPLDLVVSRRRPQRPAVEPLLATHAARLVQQHVHCATDAQAFQRLMG